MTFVRLPDTFCAVTSSTRGGRILMDLSAVQNAEVKMAARRKRAERKRGEEDGEANVRLRWEQ